MKTSTIPLILTGSQEITVPVSAELSDLFLCNGKLAIHAYFKDSEPTESRTIALYGTSITDTAQSMGKYIGSLSCIIGSFRAEEITPDGKKA